MKSNFQPNPVLASVARALASSLEPYATDYPLVQLCDEGPGPALAWQYASFVVEVFVVPRADACLLREEAGGVAVQVASLADGMRLLGATEAIVQRRDWPYFRMT